MRGWGACVAREVACMAGGECVSGWGIHGRQAYMAGRHTWQGVCVAGGHVCWASYMVGACVTVACVAGVMCDEGHAWPGACMAGVCVAGGMCGRGHAWQESILNTKVLIE